MNVLTSSLSNENEFRFHFLNRTKPWLGAIEETDSETKVDVKRIGEFEAISFRTQGELVASFRTIPDQDPLLQIYGPSSDVDLHAFSEAVKEIYSRVPEIVTYLRDGFKETPEELVGLATSPGDKVVMAAIMGVEFNVDGSEQCGDCGGDIDNETHNCI
ncbi:MAG: hypothetical protein ACYDBP_06690 [Leptospirales bacterium]